MPFPRFSSQTKVFTAFATIAALSLLPAAARADQFQYVFSGTAWGCENTTNCYTSSDPVAFTMTFTENTSALANLGSGYYAYQNVNASFEVGGNGPFTLTGVNLEVNSNPSGENVDFYDSTFTNGLGLTSSLLNGYTLTSPISIALTSTGLTPTIPSVNPLDNGIFTDTASDTFQFQGNSVLGFTATDLTPASTPEPSSLLLMGSGLAGLATLRRRFVKA
jgi:hypothetical protein